MKQISLLLISIALVFSACKKDDDEVTTPLSTIEVSDDITSNTTWSSDHIYLVINNIDIRNSATLTIEAGTIVKFKKDVEINIGYTDFGTIKAIGTAEKPILFTSNESTKSKGDWNGLWLYDGANGCEFAYCTFEYGGGYSNTQGVLNMRYDTEVPVNHCNFRYSDGYAIELRNDAKFVTFSYNTFSNNTNYDIKIPANSVYTLGTNNIYSSQIWVEGDYIDKIGDVRWLDQGTNFIIDGDINVGSATGTKLIIEPGCVLSFNQDAELGISGAYGTVGVLEAIGTQELPILFTSASLYPNKGDWDGIWFYTEIGPNSILDYCNISYGGSGSYSGNIVFKYEISNKVSVTNCNISNSQGYGLYHQSTSDATTPILSNNTYANNELGDKNF
ncbi:MAG: hypothetical protein JXR60_06535 [Bacteroidales bacterium]|nr:hypothetical protein [Bacteroidales bacterium]